MSATTTKNCITLKGSAAILQQYLSKLIDYLNLKVLFTNSFNTFSTYLDYGINSILFQRGIYPAENFTSIQQYGLTILMSKDDKIKEFLKNVLGQAEGSSVIQFMHQLLTLTSISEWLSTNQVEKVSMIISNVQTKEVLECWDFKVEGDLEDENQSPNPVDPSNPKASKCLKKIQAEIGAVMRQIAATVSLMKSKIEYYDHLH